MKRMLPFTKMQALGNDYIYIDCLEGRPEGIEALVPRLSDRRKGIGGDGVILIERGKEKSFAMQIFNADGSDGVFCGNGSRCVAKYLFQRGYTAEHKIEIETKAGIKKLTLHPDSNTAEIERVTLNIGAPTFSPTDIPTTYPGEAIEEPFELDGFKEIVTCVNVSVPFAVFFVDELRDEYLEQFAPKVEYAPQFPLRTNVMIAKCVSRTVVEARPWERGSGETFACGTGAAALLAAGVKRGLIEKDIEVRFRGGELSVSWLPDGTIEQTGTAELTFEGQFEL